MNVVKRFMVYNQNTHVQCNGMQLCNRVVVVWCNQIVPPLGLVSSSSLKVLIRWCLVSSYSLKVLIRWCPVQQISFMRSWHKERTVDVSCAVFGQSK